MGSFKHMRFVLITAYYSVRICLNWCRLLQDKFIPNYIKVQYENLSWSFLLDSSVSYKDYFRGSTYPFWTKEKIMAKNFLIPAILLVMQDLALDFLLLVCFCSE